jgi:hypothetical protein
MSKRSAAAERFRNRADNRAIESMQMRKLDVGAPATADWCLASLRAALDGARLDGVASYATISLRRHVEARIDAAQHALRSGQARLVGKYEKVHADLTAMLLTLARIEDAIAQIITDDGVPGEVERIVLRRLVHTLGERLTTTRQTELELSMHEHWIDLGGSG